MSQPNHSAKPGFRLGIYVFKDAEIVDFAAPYGVFSVARRYDPELDVFLIADSNRPVQAQAGFTVLPNYSFSDAPAMDAFLIPGGFGTRQEMHNRRLFSATSKACRKRPCSPASAPARGFTRAWGCSTGSAPPTARNPTGSSPRASA
jgi:transcriptional regulator GlxA family with amidase domain